MIYRGNEERGKNFREKISRGGGMLDTLRCPPIYEPIMGYVIIYVITGEATIRRRATDRGRAA